MSRPLLPSEERNRLLRSLLGHPAVPGLVALLDEQEEAYVEAACRQPMAADPNKQSHALGSVFAIRSLREDLVRLIHEQPPEVKERKRRGDS